MAVIMALKVKISSSNKALSDSLSMEFNGLKLEFQKVYKQVSELNPLKSELLFYQYHPQSELI